MGFLANRRDKLKELNDNAVTQGRKDKGKAAGAEVEISRFFSSGKRVLSERNMNRQDKQLKEAACLYDKAHGHAGRAVSRAFDQTQPPYLPVDLPAKAFLGFGNRGAQPLPSIEAHGPMENLVISPAPSEVAQPIQSRLNTSYTWSRTDIASNPTCQKRVGELVQPSRSPVVSTALNPAEPTIKVGQLPHTPTLELRLPDTQARRSHKKPCRYSSSAESVHHIHPKIAIPPLHSQPIGDAHRPTEAGKAFHETGKLHGPVENQECEPEQRPAVVKMTCVTDVGHDVHVAASDAKGSLTRPHGPDQEVQYLESLLDACKTTLSGLRKVGYDPLALRATAPSAQPDSIDLDEVRAKLAARSKGQTHLSPGVAETGSERLTTLRVGSRDETTRSSEESVANRPSLVAFIENGSPNYPGGASRVAPIDPYTSKPLSSTSGRHTQQRAPYNPATAFHRRTADLTAHELQDTRTPLANSTRVFNPHQSPRSACVNADPQQGSGSMYSFEFARQGHNMDWLGSSRHIPLGPGPRNLGHSNYDVGDSRPKTAFGTSHIMLAQAPDIEIATHDFQYDSLLDDPDDQHGYYKDPLEYEQQSMLTANTHRDHIPRLDDFADEDLQTHMQEVDRDDETRYAQEVGVERDVNHLAAGSETDERPVTRFWHPHRLY